MVPKTSQDEITGLLRGLRWNEFGDMKDNLAYRMIRYTVFHIQCLEVTRTPVPVETMDVISAIPYLIEWLLYHSRPPMIHVYSAAAHRHTKADLTNDTDQLTIFIVLALLGGVAQCWAERLGQLRRFHRRLALTRPIPPLSYRHEATDIPTSLAQFADHNKQTGRYDAA
ncbi:hypothetical protein J6590_059171 [Homalodisca vitripennis]|nr:hypothetical protein J6590_059171 [Homalodisca vitripennis]